ncbi:MAG: T9SS type A sorting domain-containing protein [Saprospiraceae bacterium]|nr:T9SS type A sorting domain-containing protein [Candidatus Vicinibacter affinis]
MKLTMGKPMPKINLSASPTVTKTENNIVLYQNYPNPFRDKTWIQFLPSNTEETLLEIIDLSGKVMYKKLIHNSTSIQSIEIDESMLPHSGVYLVKLSSQNEIASMKIIKL